MGIKLIITEACAIAGDEFSTHAAIGDKVEIGDKSEASTLVRMGRALYLDKTDDPTKGLLTAAADDLKRIDKVGKAAKEAAERASQPAGLDLGALIAVAVQQGMAAGAALVAKAAAPASTPAQGG